MGCESPKAMQNSDPDMFVSNTQVLSTQAGRPACFCTRGARHGCREETEGWQTGAAILGGTFAVCSRPLEFTSQRPPMDRTRIPVTPTRCDPPCKPQLLNSEPWALRAWHAEEGGSKAGGTGPANPPLQGHNQPSAVLE